MSRAAAKLGMTEAGVEQYLRPEDAAARLALSLPTIRRLERAGELRAVRLAGRLRFSEATIREYVDRCATASRRVPPPGLLENAGRYERRRRS